MVSAETPTPRRRADAERSIARIVTAARVSLSRNPDATVDDIAKAAGVGRMTLYGHFRTRSELVERALVDALEAGDKVLADVDLGGDARKAMARLLASSWQLVAESAALLTAAQSVLPAGRLQDLHSDAAERVEGLIRRGQEQGVFRTDLPLSWLVSSMHYILNGAAQENRAGRLDATQATQVVAATVLSILSAPAAENLTTP
ncbi:TetR/AcrR family transcriptional regulator [Micromonospora andamanensis]|uniref:HTH tetR-type domain-containing protein n=1 Tax=Micromonospora andamanensis TaxID=1287068 RepID=A0ABQ4I2F2_9ACTN|nr:TetR/AcrR family transcriptional regulator [Micromonospora andamanensis]GIJ12085.1 hypothetical protein Van01_52990 [Micromonospora andamanensis]